MSLGTQSGSGFGTESEIAPSSDRAERRVDGSHEPRIIIRHHDINMAVPGGDPEALEHNIATPKPETGLAFFLFQTLQSVNIRAAPNGFQ